MAKIRRIAIMIDLAWPLKYHHQIFAGTQRYAQERGNWACEIDLHAGENLRSASADDRYDGVIARATSHLVSQAKRVGVPVVNVWMNSPAKDVTSVFCGVEAAARLSIKHLIARGLRRFAYLGCLGDRVSRLQMATIREMLSADGLTFLQHLAPVTIGESLAKWKKFRADLGRWIDTWQTPIGVFVAHDVLARYTSDMCLRKNVRVPDDAAIISTFNETMVCLQPKPTLSSVEFGFEEVGYQAAKLLDQLMDGAPSPKAPLIVPPVELVARQSTDVFAGSDPLVRQAMRYMAEHGDEPLRVATVAKRLQVSRRTLEQRFRDTVGRTVSGEIARLRVERLKRHLAESDAPLKSLAAQFGFRNEQRLCEMFRRVEGFSPGEFRRRIGK